MTRFWMTILGVIGLTGLLMGEVLAEDMQETTSGAVHDCRYEQHEGGASSSVFPSDDVFRPLMADPKQPQFFATYQSVQRREPTSTVTGVGKSVNVGSVGFGENFGFTPSGTAVTVGRWACWEESFHNSIWTRRLRT